MIFGPPSQMHLRNLIYTLIAWRDNPPVDYYTSQRKKLAETALVQLREEIKAGKYANLPKE